MSTEPISVELKDVEVGDIIFAPVFIAVEDLVDPNSKSDTTKDAKKNICQLRLSLVLEKPNLNAVHVAYLASFHGSLTLPEVFEEQKKIDYWYPIEPAKQEGRYPPVKVINPDKEKIIPQWASLRRKQIVDEAVLREEAGKKKKPLPSVFTVKKVAAKATPEAVVEIVKNMKA